MPRKAEFIFPPKRCEWPILSSLTIHEAFFEVPRSTGILAGLGALFGALLTFGQEFLRMRHDLPSALG